MKRMPFLLILFLFCTGCELSSVPGVSVRPAKYKGLGQGPGLDGLQLWGHTLAELGGRSLSSEAAMPEDRVISFLDSNNRYDVLIMGDWHGHGEVCRKMLKQTFGVCATRTTREIDVLVLVPIDERAAVLKIARKPGATGIRTWPIETCRHGLEALLPRPSRRITHTFTSCSMKTLAAWLDEESDRIVLDETNIHGVFDFQLIDDARNGITIPKSLAALGLELRPTRRAVSAIYVEATGQPATVKVARSAIYSKSSMPWWATTRPRH